ncbi:hypothetical protein [Alkalihalobacterium alkalinitrilicum]|uniref:hypothetical protein n=1 Tax=Alkalihalobacterium alkalinitrilicum TaxID=427920 RepID=UPI000994E399|nr:hypothetical protein [Alkalihalobacterium alkalinitrilicum]
MNTCLRNEKGAALLLTLFIIVFVGIVGASLINTTLYGQKNTVTSVAEQDEFYKLETGLDFMLHEMATFSIEDGILMYDDGVNAPYPVEDENGNPQKIVKRGPYYYIETGQPLNVTYEIDNQEVEVSVSYEHEVIGEETEYTYKVIAQFPNSKFERSLDMIVRVPVKSELIEIPPPPPGHVGPQKPPKFPGNNGDLIIYTDKHNIHRDDWKSISVKRNSTFQSFIDYYELDTSKATTVWNGVPKPSNNSVRYYSLIKASGNEVGIAIQPGHLTYAKNVEISGCGSSGSVTIHGVLIAENIDIGGNCKYILSGGIIAKDFTQRSNATTLEVDPNGGFDEDGGADGYEPPPREIPTIKDSDYNWGLNTHFEITNMETNRK